MYCSDDCKGLARWIRDSLSFYPAGLVDTLPETLHSSGVYRLAVAVLDSAVKESDIDFLLGEESDMYFDLAKIERDYFLRKLRSCGSVSNGQ